MTLPRWRLFVLICICAIMMSGYTAYNTLEQITLPLILGLDLDEDDNLIVSMESPVYSKEASKRTEEFEVKTYSIRRARNQFDSLTTGIVLEGKIQVLLIGDRLLKQGNWFDDLDVLYRNAKAAGTTRVVAVEGKAADLIRFQPKDKPRLPLHLLQLIDTAYKRNITVKTTLHDLHRQMFERGLTPVLTEIKKGTRGVEIIGTALLDKHGKKVESISHSQSMGLLVLQSAVHGGSTLSYKLPQQNDASAISISMNGSSRKIKTLVHEQRFAFEVYPKLSINLAELTLPMSANQQTQQISQIVQQTFQKDCLQLIKLFQTHHLDPVGFGIEARAYQYSRWKQVQENWTDEFAKAEVQILPKIKIISTGAIQ